MSHGRTVRTGWTLAISAGALLGSCRSAPPPRIAYPAPWVGSTVAQVAQATIDAWGRGRVVEVPDSAIVRPVPPGLAGEVDYATATAAMPGLVAAIGPQSSRATLLVARIFADQRIPLIAATATSRRLQDLSPMVFQLAPDGLAEGDFMAEFIVDRLAARRVTLFYLIADEYGLDLRDGVIEGLQQRGVTPVDQVGIVVETDFARRVAQSLRRAKPDVVVIAARAPEAAQVARALYQRLPHTPVVVGDGAPLTPAFATAAGAAATTVYGVTWWHPDRADSASRAFVARYERIAGRAPSASETMYYDAIMLAAQAVRDVGADRAAIRHYLADLGTHRPPYHGISGPIAFGPHRPINLVMTHIEHGQSAIVGAAARQP
jgi:branched-chain amino acid transport system substrate-binding protein